jgi:hypothetical protein
MESYLLHFILPKNNNRNIIAKVANMGRMISECSVLSWYTKQAAIPNNIAQMILNNFSIFMDNGFSLGGKYTHPKESPLYGLT